MGQGQGISVATPDKETFVCPAEGSDTQGAGLACWVPPLPLGRVGSGWGAGDNLRVAWGYKAPRPERIVQPPLDGVEGQGLCRRLLRTTRSCSALAQGARPQGAVGSKRRDGCHLMCWRGCREALVNKPTSSRILWHAQPSD